MPRRLTLILFIVLGLLAGATAAVAAYRAWFRPPPAGLDMADFERRIRTELSQSGDGYLAIIGDSITAVSADQAVCGRPVMRLAYGGARVDDALQELLPLVQGTRPAALIIAIGVNDAQRRIVKSREQLLADFTADYRTLLQRAMALTPKVAVVLSPPVGQGQPMGDVFFDPGLITAVNGIIQAAATDAKLPVLSLSGLAKPDGFARADVTFDGVHLTPAGYAVWSDVISKAWAAIKPCAP